VLAVLSGADLAPTRFPGPDRPLTVDEVYFVGQPVIAVVAETEAAAADAAALVRVSYEALAAGGIQVAEGGFDDSASHGSAGPGSGHVAYSRGGVEEGLRASSVRISSSWEVVAAHPAPLKPHALVADAGPDGGLTVWTPTEGVFLTRSGLAGALGLLEHRIRVVPMTVGGAFGSKMLLLEPLACVLAMRVGRPVKLVLTRQEEFLVGRGAARHSVQPELGADADGRLLALKTRIEIDKGAGKGGGGVEVAPLIAGPYRIPSFLIERVDLATHKAPVGAYRAPGAMQACLALETALDELASRLGLDPVELRLRNLAEPGYELPDGDAWNWPASKSCLQAAREHPLCGQPGVGIALGVWRGGVEPAAAECRIDGDGIVRLRLGAVDISRTSTALGMIAAEVLSIDLEQVRVEVGDSDSAPHSGPSAGSRIIYTVGRAVENAAPEAKGQLLKAAGELLEAAEPDLELEAGRVFVRGVPGRSVTIAEIASLGSKFAGTVPPIEASGRAAVSTRAPMVSVHLAQVAVDGGTGELRIVDYAAIQDVGRALDPLELSGQIHGGALQSLGRVLGEAIVHDDSGQLRTASFADYELLSIDQTPPSFDIWLVEEPSPDGAFGAKGAGEPPVIPGPAAVVNAIASLTGRRLHRLPVSPEDLVGIG
jgi:CO/xanthine dehydrogenase Mo-binding subunit